MKPNKCKLITFLSLFLLFTGCQDQPLFVTGNDVGNPKLSGSFTHNVDTHVYKLTGAGTNMWADSDEFFMVWKEYTGDFTLSVRIAFEGEGVDPHRKMGLIIRESLDGDAVYADVAVHGDGLTSLQYRVEQGAETQEVVSPNKAPDHILLQRIGNRIVMKTAHGALPTEADGEITLGLPSSCYVGLFICSHNPDVRETGCFSDVKMH